MKYHHFLHKNVLLVIFVTIYTVSITLTMITQIIYGRYISTTYLIAHMRSDGWSKRLGLIVIIPVTVVTVVSLLSIQILIVKKRKISPAEVGVNVSDQDMVLRKKAKSAMTLILAVSGAYWVTYLPAIIVINVIHSKGYSLQDVDKRKSIAVTLVTRYALFLYTSISSVMNPCIFYCIHPEIQQRVQTFKRFMCETLHSDGNS